MGDEKKYIYIGVKLWEFGVKILDLLGKRMTKETKLEYKSVALISVKGV